MMKDGRSPHTLKVECCTKNGMSIEVVAVDDQPWFVIDSLTGAHQIPEASLSVREVIWPDGEKRPTRLADELGLYWVLLRSEEALQADLARWVFDEVVPAIRKSGRFRLFQEAKRLGVTLVYTGDQWEWLKLNSYLIDVIPLALAGFDSIQITQSLAYKTVNGITVRKQIAKLRELGFLPKNVPSRVQQLETRIKAQL